MSSKYTHDVNTDSKEPFIEKLNGPSGSTNPPGGPSTYVNNVSNNSNNHTYQNGVNGTSNLKQTNKEVDYSNMERTIARLKIWLFVMFGVTLLGFIILIIVVPCLYVSLNYELVHHRHKPKVGEQMSAILEREELCVPRDDLVLGHHPDEDRELSQFTIKEDPNGVKLCVEKPVELLKLLKLVS